ncbi:MAG: 16S rRNA (cytosine(967)-C(5))-methyltransferase RsmB [Acetobacter sp.]|nr:16S rRNA (cytosine(967)-C(5))-methyltransferase RsmB [Bacteroides sp.]MCM1340525.1 16S rRNA (cytosine(967)-C(5))-methyltransferase RsmB [Acetobacter sp.]MCM1433265.1 16S rRNA (cytosine(967)-C(5))-methyltransferase RsmB [Clostridiales bacterium]
MMKSSRLIAFETLYKIFYDVSYSNLALESALSDVKDDKAFISALVYGVVERKITLDYYISKYLDKKAKPKIMIILLMGAYQLLYMDKIPDNAAINESVELAKIIKQDFYTRLINAVLHKIANDSEKIDETYLKYSVPQNLLNMWYKQYGKEIVDNFLPYINGRPPVFAIPNTLYVDSEELSYELLSDGIECEPFNDVVLINSSFDLKKSRAFNNGLFHIEDLSSYECACMLDAKENDTVLDLCSAPGGKAFTIAERMNNKGKIYAFDLYEHRIKLINSGAERLGIDIIKTGINDAVIFNENLPVADKILCDVVCSGLGIIRRKPEIRYKNLDSIKELPKLQLEILTTSSRYLKQGGTLVYSTCALNKKENEKVVNAFLNDNENFILEKEKTCFPGEYGGDGFYMAKLIKNY